MKSRCVMKCKVPDKSMNSDVEMRWRVFNAGYVHRYHYLFLLHEIIHHAGSETTTGSYRQLTVFP